MYFYILNDALRILHTTLTLKQMIVRVFLSVYFLYSHLTIYSLITSFALYAICNYNVYTRASFAKKKININLLIVCVLDFLMLVISVHQYVYTHTHIYIYIIVRFVATPIIRFVLHFKWNGNIVHKMDKSFTTILCMTLCVIKYSFEYFELYTTIIEMHLYVLDVHA